MEADRSFRAVAGRGFRVDGRWDRRPPSMPASVYIDIDGESLWAVIRCDETSPVPLASGIVTGLLIVKCGRLFEFRVRGEIVLDPELRLGLREE